MRRNFLRSLSNVLSVIIITVNIFFQKPDTSKMISTKDLALHTCESSSDLNQDKIDSNSEEKS